MSGGGGEGWRCRQCGGCCRWEGEVRLVEGDIARMAAALGMEEGAFIERHTKLARDRRGLVLLDAPGSTACEWLEGNRCRVYAARPEQCRSFGTGWGGGMCAGGGQMPK